MPGPPSWLIPGVSLAAALLVAVANYLVQRWRYRIDRLSVAIDQLCTEVNAAADRATAYWLLDRSQRDDAKTCAAREPELVGSQLRLGELLEALRLLDAKLDLAEVDDLVPTMFDQLTGGEFRVESRSPDPERAQEVQAVAARLNGALRRALAARSHGWL